MIDEPEQCLHPLLQEELIKEIKEIVSKNKNLSIILATHSIYSFNLNDRINLIKRLSEKENNKNFYGETLILPIKNFDHVKKLHKNNKDPENEYILKMILDKIKIKLVDNEFAFTIQKIRDEDEEKFNKGKICFEEYVEKRNEKKHNYMNKKINE
jgi:ABC-type nitrate/sulfonate/bicarbonate transport system ATPase subunit